MNNDAVRQGMEKARAKGKAISRPKVVDKVDAQVVVQLRPKESAGGR
jgi:DNA invertase Pin-like site-specific DNA recombinase